MAIELQINPIDFSLSVTYAKDGLFEQFEYRVYEDGDDEEEHAVHDRGRGQGLVTVDPHIQRAVGLEAEPADRVIQLDRRNAQVQ